jgi:hypothetical protein
MTRSKCLVVIFFVNLLVGCIQPRKFFRGSMIYALHIMVMLWLLGCTPWIAMCGASVYAYTGYDRIFPVCIVSFLAFLSPFAHAPADDRCAAI